MQEPGVPGGLSTLVGETEIIEADREGNFGLHDTKHTSNIFTQLVLLIVKARSADSTHKVRISLLKVTAMKVTAQTVIEWRLD